MAEVTSEAAHSDRAAVIFDVDGVLRVDTETRPEGYIRHPLYPIFAYNPSLRAPLGHLLEHADGYYISLWREDSHAHGGEVLRMPELDWINDDEFRVSSGGISERALAIQSLFGNRPVAWIDDELSEADLRWCERRSRESALTLPIQPKFEIGVTTRQIERLESWIKAL